MNVEPEPAAPTAPVDPSSAPSGTVAPPIAPPYPSGQPAYGAQTAYGAPQAYGAGFAAPPRGLSIASMVCGITGVMLSFFMFGFLPALAAVILGHIGRKKELHGQGFSLTGIITGYAGIALSAIIGLAVLAAVLLPLLFAGVLMSSTDYVNS